MEWKLSRFLLDRIEVSDTGLLRYYENKNPISPYVNKRNGYLYVSVFVNGKQYCRRVHRAIAIAYLPNPKNYSDTNHINGIKTDNRIENLEWCTRKYNINHYPTVGIINKRIGDKLKPVLVQDGGKQCVFKSIKQASVKTGVFADSISRICKNGGGSIGGYGFRFF